MKDLNDSLEKLLRSAAKAERSMSEAVPFSTEAGVLAALRTQCDAPRDDLAVIIPLLRHGLFCACLLLLAAVLLSYERLKPSAYDDVFIPRSALTLTLTQ
jgi:hypothetical protein